MNRMLITILLVVIFAYSFVRIARAVPVGQTKGSMTQPSNTPRNPNGAPATGAGSGSSTGSQALSTIETPKQKKERLAKEQKAKEEAAKLAAGNGEGSTSDDSETSGTPENKDPVFKSEDFDDGSDETHVVYHTKFDASSRKLSIYAHKEACDCVIDGVEEAVNPMPLPKNIKEGTTAWNNIVAKLYKDEAKQVSDAAKNAKLKRKAEAYIAKFEKDNECVVIPGKTTYKIEDGKIVYDKDGAYYTSADEFADVGDTDSTQAACARDKLKDSDITGSKRAKFMKMFEDRLVALSDKNPDSLTDDQKAELKELQDFQDNTVKNDKKLYAAAKSYWEDRFATENDAHKLAFANAYKAYSDKNGAAAAQIMSAQLNQNISAQYANHLKLASSLAEFDGNSATSTALKTTVDNYQKELTGMNTQINKLSTSLRGVTPAGSNTPTDSYSSIAGNNGSSSNPNDPNSPFKQAQTTVQGIAQRVERTRNGQDPVPLNFETQYGSVVSTANLTNSIAKFVNFGNNLNAQAYGPRGGVLPNTPFNSTMSSNNNYMMGAQQQQRMFRAPGA